jgi:tRNA dimethylallyltransferase
MDEDKPKVIAVVGPTAVGKTRLVSKLTKDLGGEIVNADSVQIYRFMDIGTAKPTMADRAEVARRWPITLWTLWILTRTSMPVATANWQER